MSTWWLALLLALAPDVSAAEMRAADPSELPGNVGLPPVPEGWETQWAPFLRVHSPPDHSVLALHLVRVGAARAKELSEHFGVPVGDTIHVFLAPDNETFRSLQAGRPPTWADATAWPSQGAIFLRVPSARGATEKPLETVFVHELVHILLGRAFAPGDPPTWLQEGLARFTAGQVAPDTMARVSRLGTVPALHELAAGFPNQAAHASAAYDVSGAFIAWFDGTYGPKATRRLVQGLIGGRDLDAAFVGATGQGLAAVESDWRSSWAPSPFSGMPLDPNLLWGAGGLLLVAVGWNRRKRFHERMARLEDDERRARELVEWRTRKVASTPDP